MRRDRIVWASLAGTALAAAAAHGGISDPALTFAASSSLGTGDVTVEFTDGVSLPDGTFIWNLSGTQDIVDGGTGTLLGTITQGSILLGSGTNNIALSFVVQAANADTNFDITSALNAFSGIPNALGRASAGITITDTDGDGAMVTGNGANGSIYDAYYNGGVGGGTLFDSLMTSGLSTGTPFGSTTTSDESAPMGAFTALGTTVSDLQSRFSFTLSANDSAGGTSIFVVIPAPGSAALLSAGMLFAARRRR